MCSGTLSVGSATLPKKNSGKSRTGSGICPESKPLPAPRGEADGRGSGGAALARGDHQVVEDGRREPALEQPAVELLQDEVAAVGVLPPHPRDLFGVGGRLERAVGPAEPVREQLLAADLDLAQAGAAGGRAQFARREGVHVDDALERLVG